MQPEHWSRGPQSLARDWINKVLEQRGWTPNRLAREAGVSPATIPRALNDDRYVTSNTTLGKISKATGIPTPMEAQAAGTPGFREPDAVRLAGSESAVELHQDWWRLGTRAAELAGYLPGDQVLVDQDVAPRAGDLVQAQSYDLQLGTAETIFRIYDPPFLIVRTMDPGISAKPLTVDGERIRIVGTVVRSVRVRGP